MESTTPLLDVFQSLLWEAESVLRRHLQTETPAPVDPNMYTHTQNQTGEDSSQSRGRTVLTILYLCVLGLCFVVPVFYYFRLHCFEENVRRELELDFTTALEQSELHREENRAARRKYIEERRARIVQLFGPVRMILKEDNFPHLADSEAPAPPQRSGSLLNLDFESEKYSPAKSDNESVTMASEDILSPYTTDDDDEHDNHNFHFSGSKTEDKESQEISTDPSPTQQGVIETKCECDPEEEEEEEEEGEENVLTSLENDKDSTKKKLPYNCPYVDEETVFVRIPVPGLPSGGSSFLDPTRLYSPEENANREMRLTPGHCTICLSNYKVGSDIVWSSNESCDHHFHTGCIEKWLMKQREGPLCPICRRDFIVDPLDLLEEENNNNNSTEQPPIISWDPATLEDDPSFDPIIISASPGNGVGSVSYDPSRLEEGLRPPINNEQQQEEEPTTEEISPAIHTENDVEEEGTKEPESQEPARSGQGEDAGVSDQV